MGRFGSLAEKRILGIIVRKKFQISAVHPYNGRIIIASDFDSPFAADQWMIDNLETFSDYCGFIVEPIRKNNDAIYFDANY